MTNALLKNIENFLNIRHLCQKIFWDKIHQGLVSDIVRSMITKILIALIEIKYTLRFPPYLSIFVGPAGRESAQYRSLRALP